MKQNQAIQALVFLAIVILTSCTTPKGFSYESHARQGKTMKNRAMRRNDTQDLTRWKCSPKKRKH